MKETRSRISTQPHESSAGISSLAFSFLPMSLIQVVSILYCLYTTCYQPTYGFAHYIWLSLRTVGVCSQTSRYVRGSRRLTGYEATSNRVNCDTSFSKWNACEIAHSTVVIACVQLPLCNLFQPELTEFLAVTPHHGKLTTQYAKFYLRKNVT